MKEYKIYRWSNGQVVDVYQGTREECIAYCMKWKNYLCEWQEILLNP